MTADEAKRLLAQHKSQRKAAAAAGVAKSTFQGYLAGSGDRAGARATASPSKRVGRSFAEFRQTYDKDTIIPARVAATLKLLGKEWLYEVEFAKQSGVSLADLGRYRDRYAAFIVEVHGGRRVWFGCKANAEEARSMA